MSSNSFPDTTRAQTILGSWDAVKVNVNTNTVFPAPLEGLDEVSGAQSLDGAGGDGSNDNLLPTNLGKERLISPSIDSPVGKRYPDPI